MSAHNSIEKEEQGGAFMSRNITPGGHPLDTSEPAFPTSHRKFANPGPLGLSAFALTTFVLSLINLRTNGVTHPQVTVGLALGYGGLVQLLAGMWEFASGNTFAATAFSSYGGFWISFAFLISPWSAIGSSYVDPVEFGHAVGFYLAGWTIFTFIMLVASLKSSVSLVSVFSLLTVTFALLTLEHFVPSSAIPFAQAGGSFGILTAFAAWYTALAGLLTPETSYFQLPIGSLARD